MYNETLWVFLNERNKRKGFSNMKTAGKGLFKMLLAFTVAISCLIGIGMTTAAAENYIRDFEYSGVYHEGDEIYITARELGIRTASTTVTFVHSDEVLVVSKEVDEDGYGVYGFTRGTEFIAIESAKCSFQTDGIYFLNGNGSNDAPYEFASHSLLNDDQRVVQDMIDDLPDVDDVTEGDRDVIEAARAAYEVLSDKDKELIDIKKLNAVEIQIDKNKAAEVMKLIDAIGDVEVTDECIEKINAALDAYRALTDKQKTYVENADDLFDAEDKYYSMLRESVQKKVLDKINALPAADKLTIANYYDVYDAAYEFNEILSEKEQAGFDTTAKKKLDEAVKAMYSLALEAGEQLLSDYGADLEEETYNELKKVVDAAAAMVEAGKMPSYDEFIDLLWPVFYASFELYDIYKVIEGADAVWTVGSTDSIVIRILQAGIKDKAFDNTFFSFVYAGSKIYIDGELTDSKFITAEEGSVIITIMPEFLKTLSTGEHTISVLFDNDVTVTSKFTIKPAASVPASGESVSHYVILGISAVLLAGAVLTLRKHMVDSVK